METGAIEKFPVRITISDDPSHSNTNCQYLLKGTVHMTIKPTTPTEPKVAETSTTEAQSSRVKAQKLRAVSEPSLAIGQIQYLQSEVSISAPAHNAVLGGSFTVHGTASCDLLKDIPGDETGLFIRHADESLQNVVVRLGNGAAIAATPYFERRLGRESWTDAKLPARIISDLHHRIWQSTQ